MTSLSLEVSKGVSFRKKVAQINYNKEEWINVGTDLVQLNGKQIPADSSEVPNYISDTPKIQAAQLVPVQMFSLTQIERERTRSVGK